MIQLVRLIRKQLEFCFWISAIILLFFMNAQSAGESLCFFHWLGINWCPGCGLGHSIHYALHLQLSTSLQYHPIGIVAVVIIFNRIRQLIFPTKQLVL